MPSTRHLLDFYLHYLKDNPDDTEDDLGDSFAPCSYWTAEEKEIFFQALKRHSRLRPELVQEEIGDTKSVWEVCSYINLLDAACSSNEPTPSLRASTSTAVEMSENWIAFEERQAAALLTHEEAVLDQFYQQRVKGAPEESSHKWNMRHSLKYLDTGKLGALDFFLGDTEFQDGQTPPASPSATREHSPEATSIPLDHPDDPENTIDNLTSMSAAERRRWRNRIYMRRKRAEQSGAMVDEVTEKLKPGRRQKLSAKERGQRGAVSFEKNKAFLEKAGISNQGVQSLGMDIFHLSAFGKLAEFISMAHGQEEFGIAVCSEILSLLRSLLKCFLVDLIRKCIIFSDQERMRTTHSKVFGKRLDKIRPDQVRHIACTMGEEPDQSSFLQRLEARLKAAIKSRWRSAESSQSSGSGSEDDSSSDASESESDSRSISPSNISRPAQNKHGPLLLWVPYRLESNLDGIRREIDILGDEEEGGEQSCLDQLEEDEEIDKTDRVAAKKEEKALWRAVREAKRVGASSTEKVVGKRKREDEDATSEQSQERETIQEGRGKEKLYKSACYVADSDVEDVTTTPGQDKTNITKRAKK